MAVSTAQRGYTTGMAAEATGLTMDQLRYLAAKDLVVPSLGVARGRGSFSRYSFDDLLAMQVVSALRARGEVSVDALRSALVELRKLQGVALTDALLYTTDWRAFSAAASVQEVDEQLRRMLADQPLLVVVSLGPLERQLLERLAAMGLGRIAQPHPA